MKKVLIVEDEILARIGLRRLLDWEKLGFELLPDATDGEEAMKRIQSESPDILLLDLNIPKINGLQILEFLKTEKNKCKVIVVSCHEEFEMVKKAMKLGAYDYLRKLNLSSEELKGILQKCLDEEIVQPFRIREIRYEEIINHSGKDIFMNVGTYRSFICILPKLGENERIYSVSDYVRKWLEQQEKECLQIQKGVQCCYFLFDNRFERGFYERLYEVLSCRFGGPVYMGIYEGVMKNEEDINHAAALAEQISIISYYDEEEKIVYFKERIETKEHSPKGMHTKLDLLKECVSSFKCSETEDNIREIFKSFRESGYISINVLRRNFMDMLGIYSMTAQKLGGAIEEISVRGDNCHYQKLMLMSSLLEIERWFTEFSRAFGKYFLVSYKCSQSEILRSVFHYIESHITTQIHLSEAAAEIGVSGAYLSTVFKKEMGQNFIEYVNMRKIELAKKMLEEGKLVYEVSDILGFENSTYFSRVFKRYTELSPDAYRKKEE